MIKYKEDIFFVLKLLVGLVIFSPALYFVAQYLHNYATLVTYITPVCYLLGMALGVSSMFNFNKYKIDDRQVNINDVFIGALFALLLVSFPVFLSFQ